MNKYVKEFFHRGLMFSGLGPVIVGIVYISISNSIDNFSLTGAEVFIAIISMYILAFLQAGASVFNQIEHWSIVKSMFFHFSTIYVAYVSCYLVNTWIPFDPMFILVFTAIFVAIYLFIWFVVFLSIKATTKKLNKKLV